eukprot:CAMPEP_0172479118 /NCGR_PEP_ID=MMETSP1066-20121228/3490_1 /TAXON_ID=671091 /ORGANISM="Coscinodiscus wailesii, Strain CCMP2513" /LENGTH=60 /DNA_ID=CAMNT_0013239293 /DNA_START=257 /DNA_END=436 /DNA_ORIENTATION=-
MNSLNPDNEKMELIITARRKKRAQMAAEKSHGVTDAHEMRKISELKLVSDVTPTSLVGDW